MKAVTGAIEIGLGAVLVATGIGAAFGASLIIAGASTELSVLANALQGRQGMANTIRQSAAPRRVIYGTQRVGAVEVFESTTGSSKDQYNFVHTFSAKEITNFLNVYLDGRQVYWAGSGPGWTVRNGIGFGGGADGQNHIGPDGSTYNFANATSGHRGVYIEPRFGDQPFGDYMESLNANDPRWGPSGGQVPSLVNCAYLYVKAEYNTDDFPQKPDVKATIKGKAVYDPRTGETVYSENWALIVADVLSNSDYGLGDAVNTAQLVAAANICDELVPFTGAGGGQEARYTCHYTWSLEKGVGEVLTEMMTGAGGRISFIEGEWYIFPGAYVGPSLTLDSSRLLEKPTWTPQRKFRDKINRVQGTYIAPNFPYSVAGDQYDANGWYNGQIQNNFPYAFAQTSWPTFAMDVQHGYAADQWLDEDGGVELPATVDFATVLSITQAQRLAKIMLLRNRQQGSGTLTFGPEALQLQPNDTFLFTWAQRGWVNKLLEVQGMEISTVQGPTGPQTQVRVTVAETDPSVWTWLPTDEQTPYAVQAAPADPGRYVTAPPTELSLLSGPSTALVQADGTTLPRIEVQWDTPADVRVTSIEVQYQIAGASTWTEGGTTSVASNVAYIPALAGQPYNVQIRSLRANGGCSAWVSAPITASLVMNGSDQSAIAQNSLVPEAYTDGTGGIDIATFTAQFGSNQVTYTGPITLTGLLQQRKYYVYLNDPTLAGGALTTSNAIATLNQSDYLGKFFLIGTVTTPYAATSSGGGGSGGSTPGQRIAPTTYTSSGTRGVQSPQQAYDGDVTTCATVSGNTTVTTTTFGACSWSGWPSTVLSAPATLTVVAATSMSGSDNEATITVSYGSNSTSVLLDTTDATNQTTYTLTLPTGTSLDSVTVSITAQPGTDEASNGTGGNTNGAQTQNTSSGTRYVPATAGVSAYEIYIQT